MTAALPSTARTAAGCRRDIAGICREAGIALVRPQLHGRAQPAPSAARPISRSCAIRRASPAMSASSRRAARFCVSLLTDITALRLQPHRLVRQRGGARRRPTTSNTWSTTRTPKSSAPLSKPCGSPTALPPRSTAPPNSGKPVVVLKVGRASRTRQRRRHPYRRRRRRCRRVFRIAARPPRDRGRRSRRVDRSAGGVPAREAARPGGGSGSSPRQAVLPS